MKSTVYLEKRLEKLKKSGTPIMDIVWKIALICVGWAYVFAALGELCTVKNRKTYYARKGAAHPTIKSKCQVIRDDDPKPDCEGCKWFPGGERTRFFDCRGFTYWVLKIVCGFELKGGGATTQWRTASNWKAKGKIATIPENTLVCLFQYNPAKKNMAHTGFGYKGETIECQVGVQHFTKRNKKWTHWAIPACFDASYVPPEEPQKEEKPMKKYQTIKRGNHGEAVKQCQTLLQKLGYDLGVCGIDSDFGISTDKAVRQFQKDQGLKVDGIVGQKTWEALEKAASSPAPVEKFYTVTVQHCKAAVADEIVAKYGGKKAAE